MTVEKDKFFRWGLHNMSSSKPRPFSFVCTFSFIDPTPCP